MKHQEATNARLASTNRQRDTNHFDELTSRGFRRTHAAHVNHDADAKLKHASVIAVLAPAVLLPSEGVSKSGVNSLTDSPLLPQGLSFRRAVKRAGDPAGPLFTNQEAGVRQGSYYLTGI